MRKRHLLMVNINGNKCFYAGGNFKFVVNRAKARGFYSFDKAVEMRDKIERETNRICVITE